MKSEIWQVAQSGAHPIYTLTWWTSCTGLNEARGQRHVQPSIGRPITSLDLEKYRQIPPNCIVGGPQTTSRPTNKWILTPFYHFLAKSLKWSILKTRAWNWTKFPLVQVGQLAKKSTSPSQKYDLSFFKIGKQGHLSGRTSSVKLNSSLPDCWSSRTTRRGQFRALKTLGLRINRGFRKLWTDSRQRGMTIAHLAFSWMSYESLIL